ncbi:DUF3592 domain-containing protein [Micromonospora sp. NPDC051296]|uniref:DUF3592 domain-containing protein n=1 Tax=Micromonospora sp. NPDC051296 TaxID=3155046 RepID=UPI003447809E
MTTERSDRLVKVLLLATVMSGVLLLLAAASVLKTIDQRNGVYEDGRVAEARVLKVSPGRDGEAQLEYVANGERYEGWAYCGAWCPEVGDSVEVEYAASNPRRLTLLDDREFSPIALAGIFGLPVALLVLVPLLRREVRRVMRVANSVRGGETSRVVRPTSSKSQRSFYRNGAGLIALGSALGGVTMSITRGVTIPGVVLLAVSAVLMAVFGWHTRADMRARRVARRR